MSWHLETRRGQKLATGTLEQMLTYLKYMLQDGEYRLIGDEVDIPVRRHRGVVYPFDRWEGWSPAEVVKQLQSGG
jgi:hypothetical protein